MFVIRQEQIQHFIAADEDELAFEVAKAVRKATCDRVASYDDAQLRSMVKLGIERARANKLTAAEDISAFVAVMFEVAPRFDEQKDIRQILDNETLPPDVHFYQIFDFAQDQAWAEAERRYDDDFWFPA
ncbi:MAG: hypothetical protein ABI878_15560 [Acidobacteriota bacterium]